MKTFGSALFSLITALVALDASFSVAQDGPRASYYKNGEIHVNVLGSPETKPLTSGYWDFKPSWSQTGDRLVFFRRLKDDPDVGKWITAIHIINADGTGLHQLTDGTFTDFNPTWTRDGTNTPVWNRKNAATGSYYIMSGKVGGKPGEEIPLTDKGYHAWVHSAVRDGRLLVAATPPKLGRGYYLMTPQMGGEPKFGSSAKIVGVLAFDGPVRLGPRRHPGAIWWQGPDVAQSIWAFISERKHARSAAKVMGRPLGSVGRKKCIPFLSCAK